MNITNKTRLNMVIGYPLVHTQSPLLHNTVYARIGLDSVLLAQPHQELKSLVTAIKALSVELTAVTMPFKEQIFDYLDVCSAQAEALKAVNTLVQRDGKLYGYNTDIDGIEYALRNYPLSGKQVLVIGAGGTARTLAYLLLQNKANILWMNRTEKNAIDLASEFGGEVVANKDVNKISPDIIVNTTPVGMFPRVNESFLPDDFFNKNQIVLDMVYNPVMTKLLKQAEKHHATIISGIDMFIAQGLKQIELLTQKNLFDQELIAILKKALIQNQMGSIP